MSTSKKRLAAVAASGLVFVIGAGGIAQAAWQGSGNGNAYGKGASLGAPTSASAAATTGSTATSMTISVTGGPSSSSATPSGYRVDRVSPAGTGVCYIVGATGSCNDTGRTANTSYQYNVFSVIGTNLTNSSTRVVSWTSASSLTTAAASTASSHSFTVTPTTTTPTAGTPFNVTLVAKLNGATDVSYAGAKTLDWSGGQTVGTFAPTYPADPVSFTAGSATVSVTLFKAARQTVSVSDHDDPSYVGSTPSLVVAAGEPQLGYTGTVIGTTSVTCSPTTAVNPGGNGTTFKTQVQVFAHDTWGNAVTLPSSGNISVTLTLNPTSGFKSTSIANNPQTIALPATTSSSSTPYSMSRSTGGSYSGTLTAGATGYASAVCALDTSA